MKKEDKLFTVYAALSSLIMLAILCVSLNSAKKRTTVEIETPSETCATVYVYLTPDETSETFLEDTQAENAWIIREYEGQIGIFTIDGVLINGFHIVIFGLGQINPVQLFNGAKGFDIMVALSAEMYDTAVKSIKKTFIVRTGKLVV